MGMGMSLPWLAWWAASTALAWGLGGVAGVLAAQIFWVSAYIISLFLHPDRNCWSCKGSGRHRAWYFAYARRPCRSCGGSGTRVRLGARLLLRRARLTPKAAWRDA